MTDHNDPAALEQLLADQYKNFPPIELPSEFAELFQTNTLMLLIKLARYKFAARMLKKSDDVLEVGSGSGLGSQFLAQHSAHVTGIEIKAHDHSAALAANRRDNVTFLHQSFFDYPQERRHDAVISLDVLEHLYPEDGARFVAQMARHTKPEGFCLVGTPSIHSFPHQSAYSKAGHVKCYDQAELVELMDRHFARTFAFSMNDEIVHTGHPKMAWYYFVLGLIPKVA